MDKKVVVTGASLGIGRATVDLLLDLGWQVWGLDLEHPEEPVSSSAYQHHVCNIADPADIESAFAKISAQTANIGALICNAGVAITGDLKTITIEEVDTMYRVNLRGHWLTIRAAIPLLRNGASVDDPSRVVVVGSIGGMRPKVGNGFYSAFKQSLHTISNIFAVELASLGITVNTVAPGTVDTRMSQQAAAKAALDPDSKFRVSGLSPLGRIAVANDVAHAINFFLNDETRYINGAILPVDGGTRAAYSGVAFGPSTST